jgi:hypothetical protein
MRVVAFRLPATPPLLQGFSGRASPGVSLKGLPTLKRTGASRHPRGGAQSAGGNGGHGI